MSEQQPKIISLVPNEPIQIKAKSFKITSKPENIIAFRSTVRAFINAGMPLEQIANAGDFLGEEVERLETNAPIRDGWQYKNSDVIEDENQIFAWQNRLTSPLIDQELVVVSKADLELESSPFLKKAA